MKAEWMGQSDPAKDYVVSCTVCSKLYIIPSVVEPDVPVCVLCGNDNSVTVTLNDGGFSDETEEMP